MKPSIHNIAGLILEVRPTSGTISAVMLGNAQVGMIRDDGIYRCEVWTYGAVGRVETARVDGPSERTRIDDAMFQLVGMLNNQTRNRARSMGLTVPEVGAFEVHR